MLAVAGAVIVTIVGDSLARAFGLVGLGGVVRFRSNIENTRDAALMFLLIGVGMACGLGFITLAITIAVIVALGLLVFDYTDRSTRKSRVEMRLTDADAALPALKAVFPHARLISHPGDHGRTGLRLGSNGKKHPNAPSRSTVVMELNGHVHGGDAAHIADELRKRGVVGVQHVRVQRR